MPPTPTTTPNGSRIQHLCDQADLSIGDLAAKTGRHRTTIALALRSRPVSWHVLGDIAQALGVEPETLAVPDRATTDTDLPLPR